MENTVNARILMLKTESNLENSEFVRKCNISNGTLFNIQNGENVSPKTIRSVAAGLNANIEWIKTGKGDRIVKQSTSVPEASAQNPWKDALVLQVKEENSRLQKEVERLWTMVGHLAGGKEGSKLNFLNLSGIGQLAFASNQGGAARK